MATFADNIEYVTHQCGECGIPFAMTREFHDRRVNDRETWYCPNGHPRAFTGESEADKLRAEVERQKQMREAEEARRLRVEQERDQVARAHTKMRARVMNGVCPCCNRTFQNLMRHMQTEHAGEINLRTLRTAFGMSQAAAATEVGIRQVYISSHERGKHIPAYARLAIEAWIKRQEPKRGAEYRAHVLGGEIT